MVSAQLKASFWRCRGRHSGEGGDSSASDLKAAQSALAAAEAGRARAQGEAARCQEVLRQAAGAEARLAEGLALLQGRKVRAALPGAPVVRGRPGMCTDLWVITFFATVSAAEAVHTSACLRKHVNSAVRNRGQAEWKQRPQVHD